MSDLTIKVLQDIIGEQFHIMIQMIIAVVLIISALVCVYAEIRELKKRVRQLEIRREKNDLS